MPESLDADVVVIGAGAVGLVAAIALREAGLRVTLVGRIAPGRAGRTVALMQGSVELLVHLGLWASLEEHAAPLRAMRIVDATGSLFTPPPVLFRSVEIGLPAFGYNIDNARLEKALYEAAQRRSGLQIIGEPADQFDFGSTDVRVSVGGGSGSLRARLVVAADGRGSLARKSARIGVRTTRHPQEALTAVFHHAVPHHDISTEFHTREGPFTLVPLQASPDGFRSSLVWVMSPIEAERRQALSPDSFVRDVEQQAGRLLGRMRLASAIGRFPILTRTASRLVDRRIVLLGEAAHALPPIGAQGLNLSFRDVAALQTHLKAAAARDRDVGSNETLQEYQRTRAGDVASRIAGVDLLNASLLSRTAGVDLIRGAGLLALGRVGALRRFAMRQGLAPPSRLPTRTA